MISCEVLWGRWVLRHLENDDPAFIMMKSKLKKGQLDQFDQMWQIIVFLDAQERSSFSTICDLWYATRRESAEPLWQFWSNPFLPFCRRQVAPMTACNSLLRSVWRSKSNNVVTSVGQWSQTKANFEKLFKWSSAVTTRLAKMKPWKVFSRSMIWR